MFIDTITSIKRTQSINDISEVTDKNVGEYLALLLDKQKKLKELVYEIPYAMENTLRKPIEELLKCIEYEILTCKFYFEYNIKRETKAYFKQWTYFKLQDRMDLDEYAKENGIHGDAWIMTNGRILSIIEVKDNSSTIRISLSIKNDSKIFNFTMFSEYGSKEITYKNLRNKESINTYIEELKKQASEITKNWLRPRYTTEYGNIEVSLKILHLNNILTEES